MSPKSDLSLTLHRAIDEIPAADWDACAASSTPFVSHAFLAAVEDSGSAGPETGWTPCHAGFRAADGQLLGVAPTYLKAHSYGEYVFDQTWADAFERAGGSYYPKLQIAVPFSPVPGPRLLIRPGSGLTSDVFASSLTRICAEMQLSSVHVTFCSEGEWKALGAAGWLQRTGLQFHWHNDGYTSFEGFLATLSSRKRKSIHRERRDANAAGLTFKTLSGSEILPRHWDAFFRFYHATVDRKWGQAYLTRDFFARLADTLKDKVVLMMAEHDGQPVAGALNLIGGDTLYGRNWGCIGEWPFLHFELCYYRAIDFAIERGLKRVEAGAQGEHKIQRGYLPQRTYSAHWIAHKGLSNAVRQYLEREREAIDGNIEVLGEYSPFKHGTKEDPA
jgi:predicted N-acyltransferase